MLLFAARVTPPSPRHSGGPWRPSRLPDAHLGRSRFMPAHGLLCGLTGRHRHHKAIRERMPLLLIGLRLLAFAARSDPTAHGFKFPLAKPADLREGRALCGLSLGEGHFRGRTCGDGDMGGIGPIGDEGNGCCMGCGVGGTCGEVVTGMGAGIRGMGFDPGAG